MNQFRWILCFLVIPTFSIWSQETSFKSYSVREGLAQSQVYSISQDSLGYLWVATQGGGICQFDGEDFKTYTSGNGLLSNTVNATLVFGDTLFLASNQGLGLFLLSKKKIVKNYRIGKPVKQIKQIRNDIIFATDESLYKLEKDTILPVNPDFILENTIIEDFQFFDGRIWAATSKGLICVEDLKRRIELKKRNIRHFTSILKLDEFLVLGTYGNGLLVFEKSKDAYLLKKDSLDLLEGTIITTLFEDSYHNFWIGTQRKGVYRYDKNDKKWDHFGENEGLSNDHVKCIFEDRWNQIWIGTSGGGMNQYSGSQFLHYTENSGLNGDYIYSILRSRKGELWVATSGNGFMRINDTLTQVYNSKNGFHDVKVKAVAEGRNELIWIGTEGKGLSLFYSWEIKTFLEQRNKKDYFTTQIKDTIINFDSGKLFPATLWVNCFAENSRGDMYISSLGGGLVRARVKMDSLPRVTFTKIRMKGEQSISNRINDMLFDSDGSLILATNDKGLGVLSNGVISYKNLSNSSVPNKITLVEIDQEGGVWFGSEKGLGLLSGDSIYFFNQRSGLSSNNIYQIQSDHNGFVWIGTEKGVDRIRLISSNEIEVKHFGAEEGFTGIETSLNASFLDEDNNLWFGTVNGLSVYKPKKIEKTNLPPVIFFNSIKLFYDTLPFTPAELDYFENSLSFNFESVFLPGPEKTVFQWKLEGFDSEWSEPSKNGSITYSNLRPGSYTFFVRAGYEGVWSEPIQFYFEIKKPYWEKYWFKFLVWGGGFLLLFLIVFLFVRRARKRSKELRQKLEMEKSLIELEQKALRLQMNPHFIFNSLNTIQHLIIEKDEKSAKYYLSKFAKLMRQILENSRERLISINDEIKTLENYLIIEKFSRSDFDYNIEVDEAIDREEEILPPMMIQPFVENAIIHGLKGMKDRKGLIQISFKRGEGYLQFEVEDNGQGRERAEKQKSQIANYHRSTALTVTQERLDNLNKGQAFKSFEIQDLKDEDGSAKGTRIIIRVKH